MAGRRNLGRMRDAHKLLFLGALAGGAALLAVRKFRAMAHDEKNALDAARERSSIDDVPTLQPTFSRSDADIHRLENAVDPTAPF